MSDHPTPARLRSLLPVVATVLAAVMILFFTFQSGGLYRVFGRWDVVACGFLAALPFAAIIADRINRWSLSTKLILVGGCVSVAFLATYYASLIIVLPNQGAIAMTVCRGLIAVSTTIACLSVALLIAKTRSRPSEAKSAVGETATLVMMTLALAFLIPAAYVDSVAENIGTDLQRSLQNQRFALAKRQSFQLAQLQPGRSVSGKQVQTVQRELEQIVNNLNALVEKPVSADSTIADVRNRITVLLHLDRCEEALVLLKPLTRGPDVHPISWDYQGLCYQRMERYALSLAAYESAIAYWQSQRPSDRRTASLASAWKGTGYAARRLNQRSLEERAYQELVELIPSGENHLLLAQCYREHQKTRLAATHSSIAMDLNPDLRSESESMLTSMTTDHFGCLQVPRR